MNFQTKKGFHLSAVDVLDGGLAEEEVDVVVILQRADKVGI
jgi:hypothetical protein